MRHLAGEEYAIGQVFVACDSEIPQGMCGRFVDGVHAGYLANRSRLPVGDAGAGKAGLASKTEHDSAGFLMV